MLCSLSTPPIFIGFLILEVLHFRLALLCGQNSLLVHLTEGAQWRERGLKNLNIFYSSNGEWRLFSQWSFDVIFEYQQVLNYQVLYRNQNTYYNSILKHLILANVFLSPSSKVREKCEITRFGLVWLSWPGIAKLEVDPAATAGRWPPHHHHHTTTRVLLTGQMRPGLAQWGRPLGFIKLWSILSAPPPLSARNTRRNPAPTFYIISRTIQENLLHFRT